MWKKILSLMAVVVMFASSTAFAITSTTVPRDGTPVNDAIASLTVSPSTFDPNEESATVSVVLKTSVAYLNVYAVSPTGSVTVLMDDQPTVNDLDITFFGKSLNRSTGEVLADGSYTIRAYAKNSSQDIVGSLSRTVVIDTDGIRDGVISEFELNPSADEDWDPSDEELEIEFELLEEVDLLTVYAISQDSGKKIEIIDEDYADDDEYEETWDGTDDDGDYVNEGEWDIVITADGNTSTTTITVKYEVPVVKEAFVTKDEFDPAKGEFTNLVFKVDAAAVVTVEVYDGTHREFTLVDEETVQKNKWYAVKWDGMDEDGDEVDEGNDWKFKIIAENVVNDDIDSTEFVNVDVDEDDVSSTKVNVTNDSLSPVIFDDEDSNEIVINYTLADNAEVYLAIYDGRSASGTPEAELLDYVMQSKGPHTIKWNARDDDGKELDDDIYTYKIISKTDSNRKDTETGSFVVGNESDEDLSNDAPCAGYYNDLSSIDANSELCEAIVWATNEEIFRGYGDGSFQPYKPIARAEVIKVILEAYNVSLIPANGDNLGFNDVDLYAWYMKYAKTAQFYGMLDGYEDGTEARLYNNVVRVEMLKFALEAARSFAGESYTGMYSNYADVDYSDWYAPYLGASFTYDLFDAVNYGGTSYLQPGRSAQRGEVALMLFRMDAAGLL